MYFDQTVFHFKSAALDSSDKIRSDWSERFYCVCLWTHGGLCQVGWLHTGVWCPEHKPCGGRGQRRCPPYSPSACSTPPAGGGGDDKRKRRWKYWKRVNKSRKKRTWQRIKRRWRQKEAGGIGGTQGGWGEKEGEGFICQSHEKSTWLILKV